MKSLGTAVLYVLIAIISGCSSNSRYSISDDIAPAQPISVEHIEDANPKYEPYSLGGNRDYNLRGGSYKIVKNPKGFTQTGKASWYGKKFHGHLTSNGEIYDMYSMSAAHKTLPIPSYVKVYNLDNNTQTVVRVNDRGPFHEGRIIDLSYAAATKLGVTQTGTANVKIEVIIIEQGEQTPLDAKKNPYVIQVASSPHKDRSRHLSLQLHEQLTVPSFIEPNSTQYRIMLGPFTDYSLTAETLEKVQSMGHKSAFIKKAN